MSKSSNKREQIQRYGNVISKMNSDELMVACTKEMGWVALGGYLYDMNACMELMKKIWDIDSQAIIERRNKDWYMIEWDFSPDWNSYWKYAEGSTLSEAIMRAFLLILEENEITINE